MKRHTQLLTASLLLAALAPLQTRAAVKTWSGAASAPWDTTSFNWSSPSIPWAQGDDAIFGAAGNSPVVLAEDINVNSMTFNTEYTISAAGRYSTNAVIVANATNNIALSIYGTNTLTKLGTNTTILLGDASVGDPNHYTGGTYVRAGTLIVRAVNPNGATSYAVSDVEAVDSGATLQMGTLNDGSDATVGCIGCASNIRPANNQLRHSGSTGKLNLTGGTYDGNGDNNGFNYPPFSGTGTIINSSPYQRAVMKLDRNDGSTFVWAGQIKDGGVTIAKNSGGPGYQMGVDMNGGNFKMIWSGSNSFSGFIRMNSAGSGNKITLTGNGTLGYPTPYNCPSRHILMNSGSIDFGGTSQKTGIFWTKGDGDGCSITNSAFGTLSTVTVCFNTTNSTLPGNGGSAGGITCSIKDDPSTGGTIGITKQGVGIQAVGGNNGVNSVNGTPVNNYHGDTVVNNGILEIINATAISANSAYRLNGPGVIQLDYAGTANVKQLFVNGGQKANGTYGAAQFPGIITGGGTLTVTGSTGVDYVWDNAEANLLWSTTNVNWTGSAFTQDGGAIFNAAGAGTVSLGENIGFSNLTFNASRDIQANFFYSTNNNTTVFAGAGTSNYLGLAMYGPGTLTFTGTGTTMLGGDTTVNDPNHFTGGTYIKSGTVILNAAGSGSGATAGSAHAIESIEALDTGATLVIPNFWNGSTIISSSRNQVGASIPGTRLNMTGGTIDLNDCSRNNSQDLPIPDGSGLIVNNGSHAQAGLFIIADGLNHTFSGVIADGNNGVLATNNNLGFSPGYQIGIVQVNGSKNGGGGVWTLSGPNTFSGSIRLSAALAIKLVGAGTLGKPTTNGLTGPLRIADDNSYIDMNGTSQTLSLMVNGNTLARIVNNAVGTVSTMSLGMGMEQATRNAPYRLMDNDGTGGIMAYRKINSAPYIAGDGVTLVTTCRQGLRNDCVATYSGDTTIDAGVWDILGTSGVSPNSAYRINTTTANFGPGKLRLGYVGNANCRQLWIDGVQQPNGVYAHTGNGLGAIGVAGIDTTGTGTITVTGFAPVVLNASNSGGNLNLSWSGVYKLQSSPSLTPAVWTDVPGAVTSPVVIPINPATPAKFYRLATL